MAQLFRIISALSILKPALALESNFIEVESLLSNEVSTIKSSEKLINANDDTQQNNFSQTKKLQIEQEFYTESRYIDEHDQIFKPTMLIQNSACDTIDDCPSNENFYSCTDNECVHKSVFPSNLIEWVGVVTYGIIMALCNVAGIGGGGITQPIIQGFFRFPIKPTIAISQFTIVCSTVLRFLYQIRAKHPQKPNAIVVDYGLACAMMPATLAGTQIGSQIILKSFPGAIIQILLELLLLFLTWNAWKKARALQHKENVKKDIEQSRAMGASEQAIADKMETISDITDNAADVENDKSVKPPSQLGETTMYDEDIMNDPSFKFNQPLDNDQSMSQSQEINVNNTLSTVIRGTEVSTAEKPEGGNKTDEFIMIQEQKFYKSESDENYNRQIVAMAKIAKNESTHLQWQKQGIIWFVVAFQIYMNLSMGSSSSPSIIGTEICGGYYWSIQVIFTLICASLTYFAIILNQREYKLRKRFNINYINKDLSYAGKSNRLLIGISFIGGIVAGALGLGGGSIYNPALLSMGVDPRVSGATGMYLVLWGAVNSTVINATNGQLDLQYSLWLGLWSMLGAIVGLVSADIAVRKLNRPSIFVWLLFVVFLLSVLITPVFSYFSISSQIQNGDSPWVFNSLC